MPTLKLKKDNFLLVKKLEITKLFILLSKINVVINMNIIRVIIVVVLSSLWINGYSREGVHADHRQQPSGVKTPDYKIPISFIENKGQITDQDHLLRNDIDFHVSAHAGLNIFVGCGKLSYQFSNSTGFNSLTGEKADIKKRLASVAGAGMSPSTTEMYRLDVTLLGADPHAKMLSAAPAGYVQRYVNGDKGAIESRVFDKVVYQNVYPGIDWVLYVKNGILEHEFHIKADGDPSVIKLVYGGATNLKINTDGSLSAFTPQGEIREKAPVAYLPDGSPVASKFKCDGNIISYELSKYSGDIVIDPTIEWSTYYGGSGADVGLSVASDTLGYVIMSGKTSSIANIATVGAYNTRFGGGISNAFVAKFDSSGNIKWATYYGGNGEDEASNVITDNNGNIYISGFTTSSSGIATPGAYQPSFAGGAWDAFVAKFSGEGSLLWGTYFGGPGADYSMGLAVDKNGNIIFSGATASSTGISTTGAYQTALAGGWDAFLTVFNSGGSLQWSTYLGGAGTDFIQGLVVDTFTNIYVTGSTNSSAGIATASAYQVDFAGGSDDAFLSKFSSGGSLLWSTYFGGTSGDQANAIATDNSGDIYIAGYTGSPSGIASPGCYQASLAGASDAFLAEFNSAGNYRWGTYFGGPANDVATGVTSDNSGNIYLVGGTASTSGIASSGAMVTAYQGGADDAFITQFNSVGFLQWSSYFGGSDSDVASGIAIDNKYHVYISGYTNSSDGIATTNGYQQVYGGSGDAFLLQVKYCTPSAGPITGPDSICINSTVLYSVPAPGGTWVGLNPSAEVIGGAVTALKLGTDTLFYITSNFCGIDTAIKAIMIDPIPSVSPVANLSVCSGQNSPFIYFSGTPGASYEWTNSNVVIGLPGMGTGNIDPFIVTGETTAISAVFNVTPVFGTCFGSTTSFTLTVNPTPVVNSISNMIACNGATSEGINFTGSAGASYTWSNNNNTIGLGLFGSGNMPSFTAVNVGTRASDAVITVVPYTAYCTGIAETFTITVEPSPTMLPVSNQTFCSGLPTSEIFFSGSPLTQFKWTNSEPFVGLAASDTGNVPSFVATNRDTIPIYAVIEVTPMIGICSGATESFTVTVDPMPTVDAAYPNQDICNDSLTHQFNFTGDISGTEFSWITTDDSAGINASGLGNIPSFTAINTSAVPEVAFIIVTPIADGCTGTSKTFSVKIEPSAFVGPIIGLDSLCKGSFIILADSISGGVWSNHQTGVMKVDNGVVSGEAFGGDSVMYTVTNACGSATAAKWINVNDCGNGGTTNQTQDFVILPNPAQNEINISANLIIDKVDIFDMLGRKLFSNDFNTANITIDIRGLANGVYLVRVNDGFIVKLVKD